jgi:hypothetical protein
LQVSNLPTGKAKSLWWSDFFEAGRSPEKRGTRTDLTKPKVDANVANKDGKRVETSVAKKKKKIFKY